MADEILRRPSAEALAATRHEIDHLAPGELASRWLDVDAVVEQYCRSRDRVVPTDLDEIIDLHQRALLQWADQLA